MQRMMDTYETSEDIEFNNPINENNNNLILFQESINNSLLNRPENKPIINRYMFRICIGLFLISTMFGITGILLYILH